MRAMKTFFSEPGTKIDNDVVVRARGLPWQASDSHVAQFFAGLDIAPCVILIFLAITVFSAVELPYVFLQKVVEMEKL